MKKITMIVELIVPDDWGVNDIKEVLEDDIGSWAGNRHPDDCYHDIDWEKTKVSHITRKRLTNLFSYKEIGDK